MSYVGGNSLREWQCVPFGGSGQPVSLRNETRSTYTWQTYIKLIDWKPSQNKNIAKHLKLGGWQERQNIYIYLYTFLLRVLMICFCRLPTSWDIRVRHVILHIKHLAVSGHCTYGPTNHCYFGCTLNLMHQVDAGNTPTFRVLWLVPVAPQGWVPLYLPQFLLILIDKFADGIKHVRSNTSQVYNIYIYIFMHASVVSQFMW